MRNIGVSLFLLSSVALLLAGCGGINQCGPDTCGGCCTMAGTCETTETAVACGVGGGLCMACNLGEQCQPTMGLCVPEELPPVAVDAGADAGTVPDAGHGDAGVVDHTLTVTVSGSGSGFVTLDSNPQLCPGVCTWQPSGWALTGKLSAVPDEFSGLAQWSGVCSGTDPTCTVNFTGPGPEHAGVRFEKQALSPPLSLAKGYGQSANNYASATAVRGDGDGGVWLNGDYSGSDLDFGGGALPYGGTFLAHFDSAQQLIAARRISSDFKVPSITVSAATADHGLVLVGSCDSSTNFGLGAVGQAGICAARFSAAGVATASATFSTGLFTPVAAAADGQGRVAVVGTVSGALTLGGTSYPSRGYDDFLLVMLDSTLHVSWARRGGGSNYDQGIAVVFEASGDVVFDVLTQNVGTFEGLSFNNYSVAYGSALLVRYHPDGTFVNGKVFDSPNDAAIVKFPGLAARPGGGVVVAGEVGGNTNLGQGYLAYGRLLSPLGVVLALDASWQTQWEALGDGTLKDVAVSPTGEVFAVGDADWMASWGGGTIAPAKQDWTQFLVKLNGAGAHQWSKFVGPSWSGTLSDAPLHLSTSGGLVHLTVPASLQVGNQTQRNTTGRVVWAAFPW